jgi:hypothetical protein
MGLNSPGTSWSESVNFFSTEGERLGSKRSLMHEIYKVTGLPRKVLLGRLLHYYRVEQRFSWMRGRVTGREEYLAYSLLGVFGVFISVMYGEGRKHAMRRLEEAIDGAEERRQTYLSAPPEEFARYPSRHNSTKASWAGVLGLRKKCRTCTRLYESISSLRPSMQKPIVPKLTLATSLPLITTTCAVLNSIRPSSLSVVCASNIRCVQVVPRHAYPCFDNETSIYAPKKTPSNVSKSKAVISDTSATPVSVSEASCWFKAA